MPKTIALGEAGLSFDFAEHTNEQEIVDWLNANVAGKEQEIRKNVLKTELQELNTTTPEYGNGLKIWQGIGSIADGFYGSILAMPESLARFTDYIMNDVASIAPGVTLGGMITKAAGVNPYELLADKMKEYRTGLREVADVVPDEALSPIERFGLQAVPQGLGSALTFMTGGAALKGLGVGSKAAIATLGAFSAYADGWERAMNAGETRHTANFMGLLNSGVGLTEAFPLGKFLDRLGGKRGASLGEVIKEGGEEFGQEFFQTAMGDFIAAMGKEELDLSQTLFDAAYSGAAGFVVGGGLSVGTTMRAGRTRDKAEQAQATGQVPGAAAAATREKAAQAASRVPGQAGEPDPMRLTAEEQAEESQRLEELGGPFAPLQRAVGAFGQRLMGRVAQQREAGARMILNDFGIAEQLRRQLAAANLVNEGDVTLEINSRDLDMLLRATVNTLNPQDSANQTLLMNALATLGRPSANYDTAAVNDIGQASTEVRKHVADLVSNYELGQYVNAVRNYIKSADQAGETQQAQRLRQMTAELLGLRYNADAGPTPTAINMENVREMGQSVTQVEQRQNAEASYPEGTTVEVDAGIEGGTAVTGRVIGYFNTIDDNLGLRVEVPGGHVLRVPANKARVENPSQEPGTKYVSPLVPMGFEEVPGKATTIQDVTEETEKPAAAKVKDDDTYWRENADFNAQFESEPATYEFQQGLAPTYETWNVGWKKWQELGPEHISPAAWINLGQWFYDQGVRETALSDAELDTILTSVGVPPALTRQESLQKIQVFREALTAAQEDTDVLAAYPIEQLQSYLHLLGQRPRTQSKWDLAKRIKKEFPKRNDARYGIAREMTFWQTLDELVEAGKSVSVSTFYSAINLNKEKGQELFNRYLDKEEGRQSEWITPEAFQDYPQLTARPGERATMKRGDTFPARLDGYAVRDGIVTPSITTMGNWLYPDGTEQNNGSSGDWSFEHSKYGVTPVIYSEKTYEGKMTYEQAVQAAYEQLGTPTEYKPGGIVSEIGVVPVTYNKPKDTTDVAKPGEEQPKPSKRPRKAWLGPYTTEADANLSNAEPVFIKPIYPPGLRKSKTRLGFAEVGWSPRDTEQLKPDELAKKHDANLKYAQQPTTKVGKRTFREPDVEIFKPAVFVVMYNQHGDPIGHYRFRDVLRAKAYLTDKLESEGIGKQIIRVKKENVKDLPKGYRRLPAKQQDKGVDYVKVESPTYQATAPKPHNLIEKDRRKAREAASVAEREVQAPEMLRLGGPFTLGFEGEIPLIKNTVRVKSRPDWGEFRIIGPVTGYPGLVRARNTKTSEDIDIAADQLTEATESLPKDLEGMAKHGASRNIRPRDDTRAKPITPADRAHQIATQMPLDIPFEQLITMSEAELDKLADSEAFSSATLLGLRIGRNIRTAVDLDMAKQAATTRQSPVWNAALAAATGAGVGQEFNTMASDPTYAPRFEPAPAVPEGFTPPATRPDQPGVADPTHPGGQPARGEPTPGTTGLAAEEQFRKDVREATDELAKSPYLIKRHMRTAPKKYQRIVNSRMPLYVPTQSFSAYTVEDFINLGEQEGSGFITGAAYRVGRNIQSVLEYRRLLDQRAALMARANEGVTGNQLEKLPMPSKQVMRNSTMLRNWVNRNNPSPNQMALIQVQAFFDPAIEAATGKRVDLSYADKLELWDDPSYQPPMDCASPCVINPPPVINDPQNPPGGTSTPDVNANQPDGDKIPPTERKKTTALKRALTSPEFRDAHPLVMSKVLPTLESGTYVPRSNQEGVNAARVIVDQYDTGLDSLRELAQLSMSIRPEDRWWNISDTLKPLVLVEINKRLKSYAKAARNPIIYRTIDDMQAMVWHDIQMMGSFGGQLLNTYRIIADSFTQEFFVDKVIRQMFEKANQVDDFLRIKPELDRLGNQMEDMPEGMPKDRVRQERNRLIDRTINHTFGEKFWSLWYNNVLSGTRTQFDNMTMSFNLIAETAAQMVVKPGNAHRAFSGALRGFFNGLKNAKGIISGDYSQRISNPLEQERELNKDGWFQRDHLLPWRESGNPIKKLLGSTRYVSNFMASIDNVVSMGGFEVRVQTLAYQQAAQKLAERKKEGELINITPAMIQRTMEEILHTTPTDMVRYRKQVAEEVANPSIPVEPKDAKTRIKELMRLGYPEDIYENAREYGKSVAGNREPYGYIGFMHRLITNARAQPGFLGAGTRAVFPFTRWASNWTNIIMDYMPPTALARMYIHSPNYNLFGPLKDPAEKFAKLLTVHGDKRLDPNEYNMLRFKAAMGTTFGMAVWAAFSQFDDEEEPPVMITGGLYNVTPARRNILREKGIHPWSIVIGGRSVSYRNAPIAGALGIVGNMKDGDRYGSTEGQMLNMMNGFWRGALLVKDMSVMSGFSELLDVVTDNRLSSEVRNRSVVSWFGRFAGAIPLPYANLIKDADGWFRETYDKPVHFTPSNNMGMFFRDWPGMNSALNEPTLNVLGEPINMSRAPWSRQFYPRRNDPVWRAVGIKALQGVFIPDIRTATKIDPKTGDRVKMPRAELNRYRAAVYKRMGDVMRQNYTWWQDADPEFAQMWLDRQANYVRRWVRYELQLR